MLNFNKKNKKYIAAAFIIAVISGALLQPALAAMDGDGPGPLSQNAQADEKTRIRSVTAYVTKVENGVPREVAVESREDMALNPNSIFLKIQIYLSAEDAEKYYGSQIFVFKLRPYEEITDIAYAHPAASFDVRTGAEGFSHGVPLLMPELQNLRSGEIFNKFVAGVKEGDIYVPISDAQYISGVNALSNRRAVPPPSNTKKGLIAQMPGDMRLLGVEYTVVNMYLNDFMAAEAGENTEVYTYMNEDYYFNADKIAEYDKIIKYCTNEGIIVTAALLIDAKKPASASPDSSAEAPPVYFIPSGPEKPEADESEEPGLPASKDPTEYIIHPNALAYAHGGGVIYYGVNTTDETGVRYFEALMSFIADRYIKEDGVHGRVYNLILGCDIGFTTMYNNCGRIDIVSYVKDYLRALRICDSAARARFGGARVYAPFDNWFADKPQGDVDFINKEIIDLMCEYSEKEGNFIWNIAWGAYNLDRLNPETWKEHGALADYGTPVVTMKNIKVLCDYINLEKKEYLPGGELRKIMLSGQSFSSGDNSESHKELQAAAFVYAYIKAKYLPDITAFIYNAHVDSKNDITGGSYGLWTNAPDTVSEPYEKKMIYDVFKYIDTNRESEKIEFAKSVLGILGFEEIAPLYSKDAAPSVTLKEATGTAVKARLNATNIGLFNDARLSGFVKANISNIGGVKYSNPDSAEFNGKNMLHAGFAEPVNGDFGGIVKIFTSEEAPPPLADEKYIGVKLRIDTPIDMPKDHKIQLILIMESAAAPDGENAGAAAPASSVFEGLANISPNKDEIVYFDISSWAEKTQITSIKLLVNPYADRAGYTAGNDDAGNYDFDLYVASIVSAKNSRMSGAGIAFIVIFCIIGLPVAAYFALFIRARIIRKKRRYKRALEMKRAREYASRTRGPYNPNKP